MSGDQESNSKPADPFESFRAIRDAYLDAMAKTMVEAVNTEAYAQASGAMLEGTLTAVTPFREAMEKSVTKALEQLSLPSRQELAILAERFTHVEMRLDDMDMKLDRIEKILSRARSAPGPAEKDASQTSVSQQAARPTGVKAPATANRTTARRRFVPAKKTKAMGK